ncbi:MAG: DUF58 domain-containing protein [Eggerthellaceae bacterium]|nr:DUF58 domain-containing protein [Eggerthellaceae bacterium]
MIATTFKQAAYGFEDRRAARRKRREEKQAYRRYMGRGRRRAIGRAITCIVVLAVFFALALIVGTADYTSSPIGWVPFLGVLLLVIFAPIYLWLLNKGIHVHQESTSMTCERGEQADIRVLFENRGPLFATKVKASFTLEDVSGATIKEKESTLALSPFDSVPLNLSMEFAHVGTYKAGLNSVELSDYINLFTRTRKTEDQCTISVMPRILPIESFTFSTESAEESLKVSRSVLSDSLDYASVREYEPGDPLKTIHWNISARLGTYMTRLFEKSVDPGVAVVLDMSGLGNAGDESLYMYDAIVESALSIASFAYEEGIMASLLFGDESNVPRECDFDPEDIYGFVRLLPAAGVAPKSDVAATLIERESVEAAGHQNIILCTANWEGPAVSEIIEARARQRRAFVIAVRPPNLTERELDQKKRSLRVLNGAEIGYAVIEHADDLAGSSS